MNHRGDRDHRGGRRETEHWGKGSRGGAEGAIGVLHVSAVSHWQSAIGSQRSAVSGQQSAVSSQRSAISSQPEGAPLIRRGNHGSGGLAGRRNAESTQEGKQEREGDGRSGGEEGSRKVNHREHRDHRGTGARTGRQCGAGERSAERRESAMRFEKSTDRREFARISCGRAGMGQGVIGPRRAPRSQRDRGRNSVRVPGEGDEIGGRAREGLCGLRGAVIRASSH